MLDATVNTISVKDSLEFDAKGNPVKYLQYTFFIADHGPFTEKFYSGEQFPDAISKRINDRVLQLREIGVLPKG
jgi:hypothetical protein